MSLGRFLGRLVLVCVVLLWAAGAGAQSAPQMAFTADVDTVGVGDIVHLDLTVQSTDGVPNDPQPGATPGFNVRGRNAAPSQTHISINGARTDRYGLTVDWALQAQRVGTFTVGPATITIGGARYSSRTLSIRVVPAGQGPQRPPPQAQQPQPFAFSPFDPWKALIQGQGNQSDADLGPPPVTTDPKLALDAARAPYYFLHATVDKSNAVVGEQVVFSLYEYIDREYERRVDFTVQDDLHAVAPEFAQRAIFREDRPTLVGFGSAGGRTWIVGLLRRFALFPLHTGDLTIDPMSVTLTAPRSNNPVRSSEALRVHVTEPPVAGRPPGYPIGDVGHFALTAQTTPNEVEQGGAVGVHLELSGTGNVPATLAPPLRDGVEWLTPELHEQLGPIGHDTFGGKRTFDYVVRLHRAGDVDLGDVTVPFWDPEQKRYEVARAKLGVVHVKPSTAAPAASAGGAEPEVLAGLPAVRTSLEGASSARAHADDSRSFWLLGVGVWPVAFGVAVAGRGAGRRLVHAWRERKASPTTELRDRVAAASAASGGTDARAADAAIVRALEAGTVAHAGVSVRGAIGGEVVERLERAGVAKATATQVAELLRECEAARFSPVDSDVASARQRWSRAREALRQLEKKA